MINCLLFTIKQYSIKGKRGSEFKVTFVKICQPICNIYLKKKTQLLKSQILFSIFFSLSWCSM